LVERFYAMQTINITVNNTVKETLFQTQH